MRTVGRRKWTWAIAWLSLIAIAACAVEDGQGTNVLGTVRVQGIDMGGALRTSWPVEMVSVGGSFDFRAHSNVVVWSPAFRWSGELGAMKIQTDGGEAFVQIVRSKWNDAWDAHSAIADLQATPAGVESSAWSSSWVSNGYRIGIVVTNYTSGTNVWWSVDCSRTGTP